MEEVLAPGDRGGRPRDGAHQDANRDQEEEFVGFRRKLPRVAKPSKFNDVEGDYIEALYKEIPLPEGAVEWASVNDAPLANLLSTNRHLIIQVEDGRILDRMVIREGHRQIIRVSMGCPPEIAEAHQIRLGIRAVLGRDGTDLFGLYSHPIFGNMPVTYYFYASVTKMQAREVRTKYVLDLVDIDPGKSFKDTSKRFMVHRVYENAANPEDSSEEAYTEEKEDTDRHEWSRSEVVEVDKLPLLAEFMELVAAELDEEPVVEPEPRAGQVGENNMGELLEAMGLNSEPNNSALANAPPAEVEVLFPESDEELPLFKQSPVNPSPATEVSASVVVPEMMAVPLEAEMAFSESHVCQSEPEWNFGQASNPTQSPFQWVNGSPAGDADDEEDLTDQSRQIEECRTLLEERDIELDKIIKEAFMKQDDLYRDARDRAVLLMTPTIASGLQKIYRDRYEAAYKQYMFNLSRRTIPLVKLTADEILTNPRYHDLKEVALKIAANKLSQEASPRPL